MSSVDDPGLRGPVVPGHRGLLLCPMVDSPLSSGKPQLTPRPFLSSPVPWAQVPTSYWVTPQKHLLHRAFPVPLPGPWIPCSDSPSSSV